MRKVTYKHAVVIPCYNDQIGLNCLFDSLADDLNDIHEILVVDDGSTMPIAIPEESVCSGIAKLIRLDSNCGISFALNTALSSVESRFIHRIDCDDLWIVGRCFNYEKFSLNYSLAIVGCVPIFVRENKVVDLAYTRPFSQPMIRLFSNFESPFIHPSVMFDLYTIKGNLSYDVRCNGAEDFELFRRLLTCNRAGVLSASYVRYNIASSSKSQSGKWPFMAKSPSRIALANSVFFPFITRDLFLKIHSLNAFFYLIRVMFSKFIKFVDRFYYAFINKE